MKHIDLLSVGLLQLDFLALSAAQAILYLLLPKRVTSSHSAKILLLRKMVVAKSWMLGWIKFRGLAAKSGRHNGYYQSHDFRALSVVFLPYLTLISWLYQPLKVALSALALNYFFGTAIGAFGEIGSSTS